MSLALAMSLLLAACSASGVTPLGTAQAPSDVEAAADPALDTALGDFGLELLRQARTEGENTFISPLSVVLCLSMAANGAAGETLAQFEELLAGGAGLEALNANCASLLEDYSKLGGDTELSIADSLWLDGRARIEEDFVNRCTGAYQAGVFAADFTADQTRRAINAWIEEHTDGNIQGALEEIDPETVVLLANAMYFEGKWEDEFDPGDTREDSDFFRADGTRAAVDMMSNGTRTERYMETETEAGVLLPYRDGRLAFLALLPADGIAMEDYLKTLDGERLAGLVAGAEEEDLRLKLPKFKLMWKGPLEEALAGMGLTAPFVPYGADLSRMGSLEDGTPLYLNAVTHGAGIEVDEQGTRAFAFTAVGAGGSSAPQQPKSLILDRPFVYGVVDLERGVPLFLGIFEGP